VCCSGCSVLYTLQQIAPTRYNILQRTATSYNVLQRTATHCNNDTGRQNARKCITTKKQQTTQTTATTTIHCYTLQHTAKAHIKDKETRDETQYVPPTRDIMPTAVSSCTVLICIFPAHAKELCQRAHFSRHLSTATNVSTRHAQGKCCSVLQCVAVCCIVLQCVAVCRSLLQSAAACCNVLQCVAVCCSVLQRVAACCSVL
jgi:hypothetical protein